RSRGRDRRTQHADARTDRRREAGDDVDDDPADARLEEVGHAPIGSLAQSRGPRCADNSGVSHTPEKLMADPVGSATSTAPVAGTSSACEVSKAAVEEMQKGSVSSGDAKASKEMDFAKIKQVLEKMKACTAEIQQRSQQLNQASDKAKAV